MRSESSLGPWCPDPAPQSCDAVRRNAEIRHRKLVTPGTCREAPVVRRNDDGARKTARGFCSPRVVIDGSTVRTAPAVRLCARWCARQREKKRGPRQPEREAERFFPTAWKNQPPSPPDGHRGGRRRWRRRRGRDARRAARGGGGGGGGGGRATKRGGEEGYPGWSRWWLGAAASKIHRNHTARLHRRSRHLPPPNRNETARVKHPILLPPGRSYPLPPGEATAR